jgi:hypothetical protein
MSRNQRGSARDKQLDEHGMKDVIVEHPCTRTRMTQRASCNLSLVSLSINSMKRNGFGIAFMELEIKSGCIHNDSVLS